VYDVTHHPEYRNGKRSKEDILKEMLAAFEVEGGGAKDGVVTRQEFINYYTNISASIGNDNYFELMIRNAWHISGGEGAAANSANRRVLVTRADGSQYVEEIKDDLGLRSDDRAGMMGRLQAQGVNAAEVAIFGVAGENNNNNNNYQANNNKSRPVSAASSRSVTLTRGATGSSRKSKASCSQPIADPSPGLKLIISRLKTVLKDRGGGGFASLQRTFRIMDDDGSKSLSMAEFKKAMRDIRMVDLSDADLRMLFEHFDADHSGSIDVEEFIQGVRDPLTERRLKLVKQAFRIIDVDGSGIVDAREIATKYDASKHPEVISKRRTPTQVLTEFLDTFDVGGVKNGMVTEQEFINYYTNLSASIDNEDYFELMIRNAWHISGGEGAAANTANRRVLVTDASGRERVQEINNDMGLRPGDKAGIVTRLVTQGVGDIGDIALYGREEEGGRKQSRRGPVLPSSAARAASSSSAMPGRPNTASSSSSSSLSNYKAFHTAPRLSDKVLSSLQKQQERQARREEASTIGRTLLDVLRVQLLSKGKGSAAGIIDLQRRFLLESDSDGSKDLSYDEFRRALLGCQLAFSDAQLLSLFQYFGT
jgi:Ca2+-binding EF-hand superfamily protein